MKFEFCNKKKTNDVTADVVLVAAAGKVKETAVNAVDAVKAKLPKKAEACECECTCECEAAEEVVEAPVETVEAPVEA